MTQGIVDVFETIEIQEQRRDLFPMPPGHGNRLVHRVIQQQTIGQAGQGVVLGCVSQLQHQRLGCAHIAKNYHRSGDLALAIVNAGDPVFDRNWTSVTPDQAHVLWHVTSGRLRPGYPSDAGSVRRWLYRPFGEFRPWAFLRPLAATTRSSLPQPDLAERITRDVVISHGVADAFEGGLGALLFSNNSSSTIFMRARCFSASMRWPISRMAAVTRKPPASSRRVSESAIKCASIFSPSDELALSSQMRCRCICLGSKTIIDLRLNESFRNNVVIF